MKLRSGSDVTDIAQSKDGSVIYVVDAQTATGNVYKSTDGGDTFVVLTSPAAVALTRIAVAPDRADAIAVTDGIKVYVSNNGGSTWASLPDLEAPWAGASIRDVAVAPARAGTLLGREYFIAVSDPLPGVTTRGDILAISATDWASVGAAVGSHRTTGTRDFLAVVVSPSYPGDRSVVALGAGTAPGTVAVEVINTATNTVVSRALLNPAGTTTDFGTAGTGMVKGSVSLPVDFDATTASARRGYFGIASAVAQDNDVYRFDNTAVAKLGAATARGIYTVSYTGTVDAGTLFAGLMDAAEIRYTSNPTVASPTWVTTEKLLPPSGGNRAVVLAASDFAASKRVFAGTSGPNSGFSVSTNGGVSFNQTALID